MILKLNSNAAAFKCNLRHYTMVTLRTSDDKTVRVQLAGGSAPPATTFVEFAGMVEVGRCRLTPG